MKSKRNTKVTLLEPTEGSVRDYAYHIYQNSGCVPGRDLENWLEARACLEAFIPRSKTPTRLHHHMHAKAGTVITTRSPESRNLSS